MKKIISKLMGGVLLFSLSMSLTSCEDILGHWEKPTPNPITPGGGSSSDETTPTMKATPLTLEAITAGTIVVNNPQAGMQYSLNGGAKQAVTTDAITVAIGDKVQFYGNGTSITAYYSNDYTDNDTKITGGTAEVKVYGNIMSLVDETGFAANTTLPAEQTFRALFMNNDNLKDVSGLLLPAETLTNYCYDSMFQGCTALTAAPAELPATSLANSCYRNMFFGCTSLTTAPALSATELAEFCYASMFYNCSSLTTAPALPVTELKGKCYISMFCGCSSLTTAPKLPATTLAQECYASMFNGCSSLTTAYVKAAYTTTGNACNNMFNGCTNASTSTFYSDDAASWTSNFSTLSSWQTAAYPTE